MTTRMRIFAGVTSLLLGIAAPFAVGASPSGGVPPEGTELGSETNLPIPRFVSLKAAEGNVRRGPSLTHRIDWVFKRRNMPLEITGEFGHWRRVRDRDGAGGWVHYSLLSGMRTVIVEQDMLPLLMKPDPASPVNATVEIGVVARLGECLQEWCRITADGYRGWVPKTALWGAGEPGDDD